MSEDIKDIIEILELAKEDIENNNENITATLDLQDLKSLKNLLDLYQKEKEKNKELENADLTTVYMNGFYDGEKKWKDKIKEKIEEYNTAISKNQTTYSLSKMQEIEFAIRSMGELLEERN